MSRKLPILILGAIGTFLALGDRYVIASLYGQLMVHYSVDSTVVFSILFSSFYIGYAAAQLPGGIISRKYGPAKVAGFSMITWSALMILLPATSSFVVSVIIAFFLGIFQGPVFPSIIYLLRLLFRDSEYATATGVISSVGDIAPAVIPFISFGLIYLGSNIMIPFIFFGVLGIAFGAILVGVRTELPSNIPRGDLKTLLHNRRFTIFGLSFLLYDFFFYVFLTWFPKILYEKFSLPSNDFVFNSVPWIVMSVSAILFGLLQDRINRDGQVCQIAYVFITISVVGMALTRNPVTFLIFSTIGLMFLNPILISSWRLSTRISGQQNSSFVGGWMNLWGNVGGILAPFIFAYMNEGVGLRDSFLLSLLVPITALILWINMSRWKFNEE